MTDCWTRTCNQSHWTSGTTIYGGCDRTSIVWQHLCHTLFQRRTVAVSMATGNNSIAFPSGRKQVMQSLSRCTLLTYHTNASFITQQWIVCWMASRNPLSIPEEGYIIPEGGGAYCVSSRSAYHVAKKLRTSLQIAWFDHQIFCTKGLRSYRCTVWFYKSEDSVFTHSLSGLN